MTTLVSSPRLPGRGGMLASFDSAPGFALGPCDRGDARVLPAQAPWRWLSSASNRGVRAAVPSATLTGVSLRGSRSYLYPVPGLAQPSYKPPKRLDHAPATIHHSAPTR